MRDFMLTHSRVARLGALLLTSAAFPLAVRAQGADARWQPWIGCWVETAAKTLQAASAPTDGMVCVTPAQNGVAVDVAVIARNKVTHSEVITASGKREAKTIETCPGWEAATWSADERRLLLRSEFTCGKTTVRGSSVFAISDEGEWIEVRGSVVGGRSTVRVVRYRPAGRALQRRSAAASNDSTPYDIVAEPALSRYRRLAAGEHVGPSAVLELSRYVDSPVAEAWLNELRQGFSLNARELVQLSDAGLPSNLIDLMVAFSYPQRFAVQRAEPDRSSIGGFGGGEWPLTARRTVITDAWSRGSGYCGSGYVPLSYGYYDDLCYQGYLGYGSPFAYGRYGYGYGLDYYRGGYYWGSQPLVIVNGSHTDAQPHGRAVNGAGYTRTPIGGTATTSGYYGGYRGSSGTGSSSSGSVGSSGRASSGSSGSASSGSSGATSSGSSGGDGGRSAKARP